MKIIIMKKQIFHHKGLFLKKIYEQGFVIMFEFFPFDTTDLRSYRQCCPCFN